jgi:hypothetical protein
VLPIVSRILYDPRRPRSRLVRGLWVDAANTGFWAWALHGDVVIMSAELELAAWTDAGEKLWMTSMEPPWTYTVSDGTLALDVTGRVQSFSLRRGPA